jgi:hypothetical protein
MKFGTSCRKGIITIDGKNTRVKIKMIFCPFFLNINSFFGYNFFILNSLLLFLRYKRSCYVF